MTDTTHAPTDRTATAGDATSHDAAVVWLREQFPEWTIEVDQTANWGGEIRSLWIARRDGHHPQSELTPAKLHSRLSDYLEREAQRHAMMN